MDNDDAAQQTRFAGIVKTPKEENKDEAGSDGPSTPTAEQRKSKRKSKLPKVVAGGLTALEEVSEGDSDEDEDSDE